MNNKKGKFLPVGIKDGVIYYIDTESGKTYSKEVSDSEDFIENEDRRYTGYMFKYTPEELWEQIEKDNKIIEDIKNGKKPIKTLTERELKEIEERKKVEEELKEYKNSRRKRILEQQKIEKKQKN